MLSPFRCITFFGISQQGRPKFCYLLNQFFPGNLEKSHRVNSHFFSSFGFYLWYSFKSNSEVKSLSRVRLFATPWTAASQAPQSIGFSRQEC